MPPKPLPPQFADHVRCTAENTAVGTRVIMVQSIYKCRIGQEATVLQIQADSRRFKVEFDNINGGMDTWFMYRFVLAKPSVDWDKPLQTRAGSPVEIVSHDPKAGYTFRVPCPDGVVRTLTYPRTGHFYSKSVQSPLDIVNV